MEVEKPQDSVKLYISASRTFLYYMDCSKTAVPLAAFIDRMLLRNTQYPITLFNISLIYKSLVKNLISG